jgi:hypothetical protein
LAFGLSASTTALAQVGVPENGFPSWAERTDLVLSNRARADPATELAPCKANGDCPDYGCYSPSPPLVYGYTLNLSARFHVANLVASGSMLQHPSPCLLASNIASTYPASCSDASPSCACSSGAAACTCNSCSCDSSQSSCVTQPFDRIALFTPTACNMACGENISAGYSDPQAAVEGWLLEQCSGWNGSCTSATCTGNTENGHRSNILSSSYTTIGTGAVTAPGSACYSQEWDSQDFSGTQVTIPKLVAGTHFPQMGTSVQFWANWYDSAAPSAAMVNVAGTCSPMTVDRGTGGNLTYTYQGTIPSGCSPYVFTFKDSTGTVFTVPSAGAYQAGSSCSSDYVTTAPASCGGAGSSGGDAGSGSGSGSGGGSGSGSGGGGSGGGSGSGSGGGGADASTGSSSGGGSGSGGENDSGAAGFGDDPFGGSSSGCGCSAVGARGVSAAWLLSCAGLAIASLKRRRRAR